LIKTCKNFFVLYIQINTNQLNTSIRLGENYQDCLCKDFLWFSDIHPNLLSYFKFAGMQQILGLRLIEKGDILEGRRILRESTQVLGLSRKARLALILSYLPITLRQIAFKGFRQIRSQDYSERVQETLG
jgi:hypothetical protein